MTQPLNELERNLVDAVRSLLSDAEIDNLQLEQVPPASLSGYPNDVLLGLHVAVGDERFDWVAVQAGVDETPQDKRDRLLSQLQDWIAESRFGWGQLRTPRL